MNKSIVSNNLTLSSLSFRNLFVADQTSGMYPCPAIMTPTFTRSVKFCVTYSNGGRSAFFTQWMPSGIDQQKSDSKLLTNLEISSRNSY